MTEQKNMIQYGCWPNCCNNCQFCLRAERIPISKEAQLYRLDFIKHNIDYMDWKGKFQYGISLLGGELYYTTDKEVQESFLDLIDKIIEKILIPVRPINKNCRYSTVTNGLYDPTFLYKVCDKIVNACGIDALDMNFSYDLKYRFKNEEDRLLVLKNINDFHKRYNYNVGVQMILTQYLIDFWKEGKFDINEFINKEIPGNILTFLYPHPTKAGKELPDFFFKREDFLKFLMYVRKECYQTYCNFMLSTKNSCTFKWTGLRSRSFHTYDEQPVLGDGKEILSPECGHSTLYRCYSDSDKCMLCDLKNLDNEIYL